MIGKKTLALMGFALLYAGAVGCDQSKAELDKTKADFQTVTAERDGLKTQLDQANGRLAGMQQQITDLQAKVAAATTMAAAPAVEEKAAAKGGAKHGAKIKAPAKAEAAATPAPAPTPEKMQQMEQHPEARKGRGHL